MGYLKHLRPCALDCDCKASPCDPCDPPPTITAVQCRTRSASKSKCGFEEFGTPSSPPKRYLSKSQSGTRIVADEVGTPIEITYENVWSGEQTFLTGDCVTPWSDTRQLNVNYVFGSDVGDCSGSVVRTGAAADLESNNYGASWISDGCKFLIPTGACDSTSDPVAMEYCCSGGPTVDSATQRRWVWESNCDYIAGGDITETLGIEHTTLQLHNDVASAVAAASWSSYGSCSGQTALTTYSSDELTITMRNVGYRFTFDGPVPAGSKLTFDIVFPFGPSPNCINLPVGVTEYEYELWPGDPGAALWIDNWALASGSC